MQVKFNKEMLIKHRFWVMLGVAVTLTLVGICYLDFGVSAEEAINNIKKTMFKVKEIQSFPTAASIGARAKQAEEASKSEAEVWREAFLAQEPYCVWSDRVEETFDFRKGLFANEIKLSKDPGQKSWPPDTNTLVHGLMPATIDASGSFVLQTRNGDKTIHQTPNVKITLLDEKDKKSSLFEDLGNYQGRLAAVTVQKGRYFGDPLTVMERRVFAEIEPENTYFAQVRAILKEVNPLDDKGNGVVQLKGWRYKDDALPHQDANAADFRFINYVKMPWNQANDFSKGAWIAQENLWVQKEIYRIIADINRSVSKFDGEGGNEKNKAYVFTNPYFRLQLVLNKDNSITFTIKNLLRRRQRLDLNFSVKTNSQNAFAPEVFMVSGDPLMPAGDAGGKDSYTRVVKPPKDVPRKGIFGVRQLLTWETAAVKRIDQISIGSNAGGDISHSHRTYIEGLRPFLEADKDAPNFGQDAKDGGGVVNPGPGIVAPPRGRFPGRGPAKNVRPGGLGAGFGAGAFGAGGANAQLIEHDLWLTRYADVSEQSRRLPVAIALIIDQEHVDRVLLHFNNSKLRFLQTQVLLNQYPGSIQPIALPDPKAGDGPRPFGDGGPRGPGREGGPQPGPQPNAAGGDSGEMETNMEIVIYGIMTLYQRYPPRPNMAPLVAAPKTPPPPQPKDNPNQ